MFIVGLFQITQYHSWNITHFYVLIYFMRCHLSSQNFPPCHQQRSRKKDLRHGVKLYSRSEEGVAASDCNSSCKAKPLAALPRQRILEICYDVSHPWFLRTWHIICPFSTHLGSIHSSIRLCTNGNAISHWWSAWWYLIDLDYLNY